MIYQATGKGRWHGLSFSKTMVAPTVEGLILKSNYSRRLRSKSKVNYGVRFLNSSEKHINFIL